jgi:uncharacterized protein (DUF1778 family)
MYAGAQGTTMSETKTARRNLRVAPADDALFRQAAEVAGESVSEFLVASGRTRAEMLLADRREFALDDEAWAAFAAALDRPAEVRPEVVELLRRPRPE